MLTFRPLLSVFRRSPSPEPAPTAPSSGTREGASPNLPPAQPAPAWQTAVKGALLPPDAHLPGHIRRSDLAVRLPHAGALAALAVAHEVQIHVWQHHDWRVGHEDPCTGRLPAVSRDAEQQYLRIGEFKGPGAWRRVNLCFDGQSYRPMVTTQSAGFYAAGSDYATVQGEHNLECAFAEAAALG